eukprot:m.234245 g.234245  ORF g.234245 m.234245 type:complete len:84 (+) comp15254_c0_seq1:1882-2133(+)
MHCMASGNHAQYTKAKFANVQRLISTSVQNSGLACTPNPQSVQESSQVMVQLSQGHKASLFVNQVCTKHVCTAHKHSPTTPAL